PVYAKAGDNNLDKIGQGFSYLSISFLANPVFLVALAGALRLAFRLFKNDDSFRIQETLLLFFITYLFFILFSGGDWMLLGRFIAPLTPVACLLGFDFLQSVIKRSIVTNGILLLLLTSGVIIHVIVIKNASSGIPLWEAHKSIATQKNHLSIFERRNQEHLRDVFVIKTLDDIISLHKTHSNAPLNIASGQGGMVFFYTAVKHQKHVRFIDIHSLTDTTLIDCLPENAAGHGLHGLDININQIINILEKNPQCPVALPDIIYDLDNFTQHLPETLKKHGYTLWHNEKGLMLDKKSFSRKLYTPNVVLVKKELAKELIRNKLQPTTIRWNDLPYQKASGF
ncbi:MAG: hypothetical protein KDI30_03900, partial [Pseudomonadales bacterium]|nr:hypothetical protein [Pseudomonadales bacterium]